MDTHTAELIDLNRILRLRRAIASGTYVVDAMKIARAMMAAGADNPLRRGAPLGCHRR